ncbi:MAG: iron ABC transporter permease [Lachnospiraceae bacterium]|nr:iron ABC transporter permease [Lachnospiraceae bacterium]
MLLFAVLAAVLLLSILLALGTGAVRLSLAELLEGLRDGQSVSGRILLAVRIPRLLAALLAGAGLAVAGALIQTVLNNPLASPSVIGVNAGAGLFAAVAMAFFPGLWPLLPGAAFLGALFTALLVFGIARHTGAAKITLVLCGVAISSLMTAGISTLTTFFPDILVGMRDFQIGGFSGVHMKLVLPGGAVILAGLLLSWLMAGELAILGLGDETAQSLGLNVRLFRFIFLVLAAALCGAAVSFAGLLGFVGLIVPHSARLLLPGASKRTLISATALLGASFLILCDTAARTLFAPYELPVGILIAFMGAPFFLYLIIKERRRPHA